MADASTVERDVQCVRCGYNLKSLVREGACPECGAPIEQSLHGDLLRYADQEWVGQIARGLAWVQNSRRTLFVFVLCVLFVFGMVGLMISVPGVDAPLEKVFDSIVSIVATVMLLIPVGICVGMWMASKPEPRTDDEDLYTHIAVRGLSIVVIAAFAVWLMAVKRSAPLAMSWLVQQLVVHACYLVIWMQSLVMIRQATALEQRCAAADSKSIETNKRMSRNAVLAFALFLMIYWIGPFRWGGGGGWSAPSRDTGRNLFMVTVIAWFSIMGVLPAALACVRQELAAAGSKSTQ